MNFENGIATTCREKEKRLFMQEEKAVAGMIALKDIVRARNQR